jgi:hypothetical protein
MALMMGKLYQALRKANVPETEAREAAEEVANFESLRTEIRVVQAVLGIVILLLGAGIWQLFALKGEIGLLRADLGERLARIETKLPGS